MDFDSFSQFGGVTELLTQTALAAVFLLLAIVGGVVIYFTFLSKKNENKFKGFWGWLYSFFNFKHMLAETLLKIFYLITSIYITLQAFGILFTPGDVDASYRILEFLGMIIIGNIVVRLIYEFVLVILVICRNTSEINSKLYYGHQDAGPKVPPQTQHVQPQQAESVQGSGVVFCRQCGNKYGSNESACPRCGTPHN